MIQAHLEVHPGDWWLVPFRTSRDVPGVWSATWLFLTLTVSR
jgi:hypothetical protein